MGIISASAFVLAGCPNYATIDLRQDENGEPMVIDINPNSDISHEGGISLPIKALGMDYVAFIGLLLSSVKKRLPQNICPKTTWSVDVPNLDSMYIRGLNGLKKKELAGIRPLSEIHV